MTEGRQRKSEWWKRPGCVINVPMTGMTPPTDSETGSVLALLEDSSAAGPVFVHCERGADRTGAVIAAYRMDHDGWDNAQALNEAMSDGMSSFQHRRQKFIGTFQTRTGVAADAKLSPSLDSKTSPVVP